MGPVVFGLLLNVVAFPFAAALVLWVRPRWLGLTLGFIPLALMGFVMGSLLFTVKAGYGIASSMWDLWPALPSVVASCCCRLCRRDLHESHQAGANAATT